MDLKHNFKNLKTEILSNAPMKLYTTYKAGGSAQALALPKTEEELEEVKTFAQANNMPFRVFGMGSNILVSDEGLEGIVCCLRNMNSIKVEGGIISAEAGAALDKIVEISVKEGFEGLESLSGIPGSAGGAVYMNAGAFNAETFDFLKSFRILTRDNKIETIKKDDVKHAYRNVALPQGCIVLSASWEPKTAADKSAVAAKRTEILAKRAAKQPLDYPSAGSVFKRPEGDYASRLIDVCGLRGLSVGGAMVSQKHAGFIINYKNATAADISALIKLVQQKVFEKTGHKLELEQILWGKF